MTIELYKQSEGIRKYATAWDSNNNEIAWDEIPVLLWKFKDENSNLWNTETPIDGTEQQAAEIILNSMANT